jgi:hypothetical protein
MSKNCYPTLLNKKATMLGSLTRYDLLAVGLCYLCLSWMKVTGIYSLIINTLLVLALKMIKQKFQVGFFLHLNGDHLIKSSDIQKNFTGGCYE